MTKYRNITREYRDEKNRDFLDSELEEMFARASKVIDGFRDKDTGRYTSGGHYRDAKNGGSGQ